MNLLDKWSIVNMKIHLDLSISILIHCSHDLKQKMEIISLKQIKK